MAKKISASDIFAEEDIFLGIRQSAEKTILTFQEIDAEVKKMGANLKKELTSADFGNTKGINEFVSATQKANQAKEESIKIDKILSQATKDMAAADKALIDIEIKKQKLAQEQLRTNQQIAKSEEAKAKAATKAAQASKVQMDSYKGLAASTRDLKNQSKELGAQLLSLEKSGQKSTAAYAQLEQQFREVTAAAQAGDAELKSIDKTVGDNFRNVGNYEEATKGLKQQLREMTQALQNMETTDPRFRQMSIDAGNLKDQINDTNAVIKSTAGSAVENLGNGIAKAGKVGIDAFAGMTGAMGLFGVESESAMQAMLKLQQLSAMSEALQSLGALGDTMTEIKASFVAAATKLGLFTSAKAADTVVTQGQTAATGTATVATTFLGKAMTALPIIAIIAGIVALVAAFYDLATGTDKAALAQKELQRQLKLSARLTRESQQNLINSANKVNTKSQQAIDLMKAKGATDKEIYTAERDLINQRLRQMEVQRASGTKLTQDQYKEYAQLINDRKILDAEYQNSVNENAREAQKQYQDKLREQKEATDQATQERLQKELESERERMQNILEIRLELLAQIEAAETEYFDSLLTEQEREEQAVNDKYFNLIEQAKQYNLDITTLEIAQEAEIAAIRKKAEEQRLEEEKAAAEKAAEEAARLAEKAEADRLKKLEENLKKQQELVKMATDFFVQQSEKKVGQIDKEISAAEKQFETLKTLAENGNINAKESLAEQQRIINEANARKEKEMKRQQRIKLAESVYSTYTAKVAAGSEHPLMETIKDTMLLQQFIASLPTFFDGTEDTGKNGNGIDGKGGFHAVLHPNERVIPKSLNEQIGSLSNEALAKMANEYQNGKLMRSNSQMGSALETALLINELKDLKQTIQMKPETNIGIGEITQSVMEIVKSTKQGNTTTYNRYKVRR